MRGVFSSFRCTGASAFLMRVILKSPVREVSIAVPSYSLSPCGFYLCGVCILCVSERGFGGQAFLIRVILKSPVREVSMAVPSYSLSPCMGYVWCLCVLCVVCVTQRAGLPDGDIDEPEMMLIRDKAAERIQAPVPHCPKQLHTPGRCGSRPSAGGHRTP